MSKRFVTVLTTTDPGTVAFIKSLFDAENICYFFKGETVMNNPLLFGALPSILQVTEENIERAQELLTEAKIL